MLKQAGVKIFCLAEFHPTELWRMERVAFAVTGNAIGSFREIRCRVFLLFLTPKSLRFFPTTSPLVLWDFRREMERRKVKFEIAS